MKPRKKTSCLDDLKDCYDILDHGCWEWKYAKTKAGYGLVSFGDKKVYTHRLMFSFFNPTIDITDLEVCHSCDNPSCCNPEHLFAGTHLDNMSDMSDKDRYPKREKHPNSKLTQSKADEIRVRFSNGETNKTFLAKEYDVSSSLVRQVLNNQIWS